MATRLISLIVDNFKRVKAVRLEPHEPVTKIIGRNGAGKTSVLDALAAALGGAAQAPAVPVRRGADAAEVLVDLGDLQVRRRWTAAGSCSLEVTTADGARYPKPQAVLDGLIGTLAYDPLEFARLKPAEQAETLARIVGVDIGKYRAERAGLFEERKLVNREYRSATAQLDATPEVPDAPAAEVLPAAEILAEIERAAEANRVHDSLAAKAAAAGELVARLCGELAKLQTLPVEIERQRDVSLRELVERIERVKAHAAERLKLAVADIATARHRVMDADAAAAEAQRQADTAPQVSIAPLRQRAAEAEVLNEQYRAAKARERLQAAVTAAADKAESLTDRLRALDAEIDTRVEASTLPVEGLTLGTGAVLFHELPLAQCSSAEQLRVSVAIGLALNPKLRLMLIRDGSLLDADSMALLAKLAEEADAQVLIERVAGSGETGVIIEDGEVREAAAPVTKREPVTTSERG